MEELVDKYVDLCRRIGPWTDWTQGAGGNISVKDDSHLIVKQSGTRLVDATHDSNYLICSLQAVKDALKDNNENIMSTVIHGKGKPSIETYLHSFDAPIIVHLHPGPLMNILCPIEGHHEYEPEKKVPELPEEIVWIDYYKPGLPLAHELAKKWRSSAQCYFFKNHGILIPGSSIQDILNVMQILTDRFIQSPITRISFVSQIYDFIKDKYNKSMIIKPWKDIGCRVTEKVFLPHTPDFIVFLQETPLCFEYDPPDVSTKLSKYITTFNKLPTIIYYKDVAYMCAPTMLQCYDLQEILASYLPISHHGSYLTYDQVAEITSWDREKERKAMNH